MTAVPVPSTGPRPRLHRDRRRWGWSLTAVVLLLWSLAGAGLFSEAVLNPAGLGQVGRFGAAAFSPERDGAFLGVLAEATLVTVAYAVLGGGLAVAVGAVGALPVARTIWGRRRAGWTVTRAVLALPRGMHEAVWGLLLVNLLGLDPWVGVLAIAVPYGAVTAKVFADLLDEVPRGHYSALLAAGAGRGSAALYGLVPPAVGGMLSYSFYRLECAVRSAVVLGLIGAGGLGYQLSLSFASLRWEEVWSTIYALVVLCGLTDLVGKAVRQRTSMPHTTTVARRSRDRVLTSAVLGTLTLVAWSWWFLALSPATLVADRPRAQLVYVLDAAWPPASEPDLLSTIGALAVDTVQMSVIAIALATVGAVALAGLAVRPSRPVGLGRRGAGVLVRLLLLLLRSVPAPVWALVMLFVLLPGVLPGAVALGVYALGVLGRLLAEAAEEVDLRPRSSLGAAGAGRLGGWLYGTVPTLIGPVLALALDRWEVAIRDTVLVGLLGAGGIGVLLSARLASFDWAAVVTVLGAIGLMTFAVDLVSDRARTALR